MSLSTTVLAAVVAPGCTNPVSEPPPATSSAPTYYQDVAPILHEKCSGCHVTGGIGQFSFDTFAEAAPYASLIKSQTASRTMPPWPPGPSTPPLLHDRSLADTEIATLGAWADGGALEGDAAHPAALAPPEVIDIGTPAISTDIGTDYVPDSSVTDDYHCFVVDLGMAEAGVATGFRITPGNGKIVHHVITTIFGPESKAALEAYDEMTPVPGYTCFGGVDNVPGATPVAGLGAWVPGVSAVAFPAGTGVDLPAGSIAVMQVHYNLAGGTDPDRTKLEVALAPSDTESSLIKLASLALVDRTLDIPAGAKGVAVTKTHTATEWSVGKLPADGEAYILGVAGHMHLVGDAISLSKTSADGTTTTLLDIPSWNFHWQGSYDLVTPIPVKGSDQITIRCEYDNSQEHRLAQGLGPPVEVTWGEGTTDEMCLGSLRVVAKLPASQ